MTKSKPHVPSTSDAAVKAKTGRDWVGWFGMLDAAEATKLTHRDRVNLLSANRGVTPWWRQMIAVEYERARGLRDRHQTASGYSVAITKTLATSLPTLYSAAAETRKRNRWFPPGEFVSSTLTQDKYIRGSWRGARLEIGFYAKGAAKAQIAVQVNKLTRKADVERERAAWKSALSRLQEML
jgi:hypothetical protein